MKSSKRKKLLLADNQARPLLWLAMLVLLMGCATNRSSNVIEQDRTSLVVVEVEGNVQMSWNSSTNRSYTILYTDSSQPRVDHWTPLAGYVNLRGTGRTMTAQDRLPPGVNRQYRLRSSAP